MGSLLSTSLGFDAITKDDLLRLGFRPIPISSMFDEAYTFRRDLVVYKYPKIQHVNKIVGKFQLDVIYTTTSKIADGNPVATLTCKIPLSINSEQTKIIVEVDCDLATLRTMMDENYLRSLI
jgi:hypothetical protein